MKRIEFLCDAIARLGLLSRDGAERAWLEFGRAPEATAGGYVAWLISRQQVSAEGAARLRAACANAVLYCADCGRDVPLGDGPDDETLSCPHCQSISLLTRTNDEESQTLFEAGAGTGASERQPAVEYAPAASGGDTSHSGGTSREAMALAGIAGRAGPLTAADSLEAGLAPDDESGAIPPGAIVGGCRVIQKVGQGGMGAVYKAHHLALDKPVALKILAPHLVENRAQILRFIREARSAAKLEHPNIVQVLNVGEENRRFYLVMQWVDGESLQRRLDREGRIPVLEALEFAIQAARGLYAAHQQNIIHRDIKPDNLMLTEENTIKIADFGLAKQTEGDLDVSQSGVILGTPYYMSPEQGQNTNVDFRTDIYSLGITLYHLVTGKVPFTGPSAVSIIFQHAREPLPRPGRFFHGIPRELDDYILKLAAKNAGDRPADLKHVERDLEKLKSRLKREATLAHDVTERAAHEIVPERSGLMTAVMTVLLLAVTGLTGWWYFQTQLAPVEATGLSGSEGPDGEPPAPGIPPVAGGVPSSNVPQIDRPPPVAINPRTAADQKALQELTLVRGWIDKNPQAHAEAIRRLERLRTRFAATVVAPAIARELAYQREKLAVLAWETRRRTYDDFVARKHFVEAQELGERFKAEYPDTAASTTVARHLQAIAPQLKEEQEAQRLVIEITTGLDSPSASFEALKTKLEMLKVGYGSTRFESEIPGLARRIEALRQTALSGQRREAWQKLARDVGRFVASEQYQYAMEALGDTRERFAGSAFAAKYRERVADVKDQARQHWRKVSFDVDKLVGEQRFSEALDLLQKFLAPGNALREQHGDIRAKVVSVRRAWVTGEIQRLEREGHYADGIRQCEVFLNNPDFRSLNAKLSYWKRRFALRADGLVPVAGGRVTFPGEARSRVIPDLFIGRTEVTNAEFLAFIKAKGYEKRQYWSPAAFARRAEFQVRGTNAYGPRRWPGAKYAEGTGSFPVVNIELAEAEAYARFKGYRIPTIYEWRYAAGYDPKGDDGPHWRKYPWGDAFIPPGFDAPPGNVRFRGARPPLAAVGTHEADKSAWGALDLGGNVAEWTITRVPDTRRPNEVIVGGAHFQHFKPEDGARVFPVDGRRTWKRISRTDPYLGFRVVVTLAPPADGE